MSHILLVEDEPGAVALIRQYIEKDTSEHTLAAFPKAAEALSYAAKNKMDLFILDIQLLDYRFTSILFTTELAGEELSVYREIKCYDFLVKPFTEAEFQTAFHAALEMGAQMQAAPEILRIEQKQFLFEYEIRNIRYIESFGKRLLIHTAQNGGSEVTDQISGYSLSKLDQLLPLLFAGVCLVARLGLGDSDTEMAYVVLPVTAGVLGLLVLGDGIVIFFRQHRVQAQRRTALLEQYLPLVEELIEQVRARQHDFNNQMMAVDAAVSTAQSLQEAQKAVSSLLRHVRLEVADKELLKCDSKVISGLLFGKMKQAELKRVRVEVTIAGAFLHRSLSEADWVELIAILLDNAIEAAAPGDVLYARAIEEAGGLRFSVWNPHAALSNLEFIQMFRRG